MKKLFWVIPALLFCFCIAEAKTVDRILAQVNDEIITMSDLKRRTAGERQALQAKYSGEQLEQAIQEMEKQALESLIQEKLLYQRAMELGGGGSGVETRVTSYIQQFMKKYNLKDTDELEAALAQQGMSVSELREQIRREMIANDLVYELVISRITLLTPEIEKYYRDHIADYTSPEEVGLSEIIVDSENQANDIYRRLQQGESFAALASQYSKGPTANKGGNTGTYLVSNLKPEELKAIKDLKESEISKPQPIKEGYIIYHIDSRKYSAVRPLNEVRDDIKNILMDKKVGPELEKFIAQLKEDAYIQIFSETK